MRKSQKHPLNRWGEKLQLRQIPDFCPEFAAIEYDTRVIVIINAATIVMISHCRV